MAGVIGHLARARTGLEGIPGPDAARQGAHVSAWYATLLQLEGRTTHAVRWARRAVREAEAVDDPDALGAAYFVLGWAHKTLGKEDVERLWQRSLEAYQRAGNLERQAALVSNLGVACHWDGRWDEALSYYEQARDDSLKIGGTVDAELARTNIAEILAP